MRFLHDGSLHIGALLASPFRRLEDTPIPGACAALLCGAWQLATGSPFAASLTLVMVTAILDYGAGAVTAHALGEYKSGIAYTGFLSKLLGVVLVLVVRALEQFVAITGILNTNGGLATMAAVSLIAVDIVSLAKHRQRLGGAPIPFLSALTDWLQTALVDRLPGRKPKDDAGAS